MWSSMLHFLAVHERTPNVTSLLNHGGCYKFAQPRWMLQVCTMPAEIKAARCCCNLIQPTHLSSGLWILIQWDWFLGVVFNQRFSLCHRCGVQCCTFWQCMREHQTSQVCSTTVGVTSLLNHGRCYKFAQCLPKSKLHVVAVIWFNPRTFLRDCEF